MATQYVTTRQWATRRRQYETGDLVTLSALGDDELHDGVTTGALVPARFVDTAAALASRNPVPGPGVVCYETDTGVVKVGDGTTAYTSLTEALARTYVRQAGALSKYGTDAIEARYGRGFVFKGANLGFSSTATDGRTKAMFVDDWQWSWITDALDKIAGIGGNTVRGIGSLTAYTASPTTYVQRVHQTWDYAHGLGLHVIWAFLDYPDAPVSTSPAQTMIDAVMSGYEAHPLMIWDVGNEMANGSDPSSTSVTLAQYIRATGTTGLITSSTVFPNEQWVYDLDPYVDFHDLHYYIEPVSAHPSELDSYRTRTRKPLLIGEAGTNANVSGNSPVVLDQVQRDMYLERLSQHITSGAACGLLVWKIKSNGSVQDFGLFDGAGDPTAQVRATVGLPDHRVDHVGVAVENRFSPVVLDTFQRPASASSVGTSPIGGAPTAAAGTWGITSAQKGYLAVAGGTGISLLIWDAQTLDGVAELEFEPLSVEPVVGIVARYVDTSNYYYWRWRSIANDRTVALNKRVAGVTTNITPPDYWSRSTSGGSSVGPINVQSRSRLTLRMRGTSIVCGLNGRRLWTVTDSSLATGTKWGVLLTDEQAAAGGVLVRKFSVSIPNRFF